jgi:hypothetical protein
MQSSVIKGRHKRFGTADPLVQAAIAKDSRDPAATAVPHHKLRPIKAERRTALLKAISRGRNWLHEIVSGASQGVEQIAARHKCSIRHVNMTISMAFIAPALVRAAIEGRLPRGVGVAALRDPSAEWSRQFERLGLAQPD